MFHKRRSGLGNVLASTLCACGIVLFVSCLLVSNAAAWSLATPNINPIAPQSNIALSTTFISLPGAEAWTSTLRNEALEALRIVGREVSTNTPVNFRFIIADGEYIAAEPVTVLANNTGSPNGDSFGFFYCNNPNLVPSISRLCYPGATAAYKTNAANVTNHFIGYDVYIASGARLNMTYFSTLPTSTTYYFRLNILRALLRAFGYSGTLPFTQAGFSVPFARQSSANCPLCISAYDSILQFTNGTKLFNSWTLPLTTVSTSTLLGALIGNDGVINVAPSPAAQPVSTAVAYVDPQLYYPGYTAYSFSDNTRAPGVGPNPGSYPYASEGNSPIGLFGTNVLTTPALNYFEVMLLRLNGFYSMQCSNATTCGSCNQIDGCGWCPQSNFCVDLVAEQPCPAAGDQAVTGDVCNYCFSDADCNPIDVNPSCFTANCTNNQCSVTIATGASCTTGASACNLGVCDTVGFCVVDGICNDGLSCTTGVCENVGGKDICVQTPTIPNSNCIPCTTVSDCPAAATPSCSNVTCTAGKCAYVANTGISCSTGDSCTSNATCSAAGICVPAVTYLTDPSGFGCPNNTNPCDELQCVGSGMSPVCTAVPITLPSACFSCNSTTNVTSYLSCSGAPAGQTAVCTITGGSGSCTNETNGCSADSDCTAVCGSPSTLCQQNTCVAGACMCNQPITCPNTCQVCSEATGHCINANYWDVNYCGECTQLNNCCNDPVSCGINDGDGDGDRRRDADGPRATIAGKVGMSCQYDSNGVCTYKFKLWTQFASYVIVNDYSKNMIRFNGRVQESRLPPTRIESITSDGDDDDDGEPFFDDTDGTQYVVVTDCSTTVSWDVYAFGQWFNFSANANATGIVDGCGVCGGDNKCSQCDTGTNACVGCQCTPSLLACRGTDSKLSCHLSSPCEYATCDSNLDPSDMCTVNLVANGTICYHESHVGICNNYGECITNTSPSSESSYVYYSSGEVPVGPEHSHMGAGAIAGVVLLFTAVVGVIPVVLMVLLMWALNSV